MTQTQNRPAIGGKVTRKTEEKRAAELDSGVRFTVGDEVHELRIGDITPRLAREVRRETGSSVMQLLQEVQAAPDVDTIATLIWVAQRIKGVDIALDDVDFDYSVMLSDDFAVGVAEAEVDDSPEA